MKPSSTFNLKKEYKRVAATIIDPQKRNQYIKDMIQAQLHSLVELKPLKTKDKS